MSLQLQEGLTLSIASLRVHLEEKASSKKQHNCREELSLKRNKRIKDNCKNRRLHYWSNWQKKIKQKRNKSMSKTREASESADQ